MSRNHSDCLNQKPRRGCCNDGANIAANRASRLPMVPDYFHFAIFLVNKLQEKNSKIWLSRYHNQTHVQHIR